MSIKNIRVVLFVCFFLLTFSLIVFGVLDFIGFDVQSNLIQTSCIYLPFVALLLLYREKKLKYYRMFMEKKMDNETIMELSGKNVSIRTLDEYITGVVKSTDGDFLVVERQKKNGVEKTFVNKNAIQTIKIK